MSTEQILQFIVETMAPKMHYREKCEANGFAQKSVWGTEEQKFTIKSEKDFVELHAGHEFDDMKYSDYHHGSILQHNTEYIVREFVCLAQPKIHVSDTYLYVFTDSEDKEIVFCYGNSD